jgi:hypothetical protein
MLKEGHHNLIGKSSFAFDFFAPKARERTEPPPHLWPSPMMKLGTLLGKLLLRLR